MADTLPSPRLCVGRIRAAHGIRGEVVLISYTADPLAIAGYGPLSCANGHTLTVQRVRLAGKGVIASLKGVTDRTAAEQLCGQDLFILRSALPPPAVAPDDEDTYYHTDLIGLAVFRHDTGVAVGTVQAVHDFGAGEILEVAVVSSPDTAPEADVSGDGVADGGVQVAVASERPAAVTTALIPFTRAACPVVDLRAGRIEIDTAFLVS
jgi:16S rRNA processing protein RimM